MEEIAKGIIAEIQLTVVEEKQMAELIDTFVDVFLVPQGFPPNRVGDHAIPLIPGTSPINVRPCRCGRCQKNEIECLVDEMLNGGIIRPITNPYSSPVLLIKKKDGCRRFSMDYRAINKAIILDKFPILLIEELHGASPSSFPTLSIKLDRDNYLLWRTTILSALEAFDMDRYVNADITAPPQYIQVASTNNESPELTQTIVNPKYTTWKKTDRLVLLWIKSLTTNKILGNITRATFAQEAWETLEKIFYSQSRAKIMQIRWTLQTSTKGALSILEYVEKKRQLADTLAAIQNPIPEDDLVNCILYGLDADYRAFHIAITTRRDPITVDELLGMLLQEEEKIEQSKSLPISANVAHRNSQMTKPQQPQFSDFRSGFKQGRRSYNSSGNSHYNSHSGNTSQAAINGSRSHSNRPKDICQICNKNGHTAL
ncbi:hypothetical protein L6164_017090 [Bauhinia variegata]|uniref:Uncharacterized protein n=1 Tax=Bauhinia variegata TaxID=167791 RepID=A0ACB9N7K6_BAUVA|nr:hypothetical protein L6164_017090 [Bauhinia variegata]